MARISHLFLIIPNSRKSNETSTMVSIRIQVGLSGVKDSLCPCKMIAGVASLDIRPLSRDSDANPREEPHYILENIQLLV